MTWRRVPPVHSPIAPIALIGAAGAALGLNQPPTDDVERHLLSLFDASAIVLTDSGTSALVLALEATVARGAVVAMPAYACIDLVAAAARAGATILLYDVDSDTLSPDLESVRQALAAGARALVVAPLFGYPPNMPALAELAAAYGVPLIEDAAQGAGGLLNSTRLGAFGDVSVVSFGRGKGTTGGSGGALLVRRPALLDRAFAFRERLGPGGRGARDVVALAAQWLLARPLLYSVPSSIPALKLGEMVFHPASAPKGLSSAAASMLRSALALDPGEVDWRRARAGELLAASVHGRFAPVRALNGAIPGYLRLAMLDTTGTAAADPALGALRGYPITLDEHSETQRILAATPQKLTGARVLRDRLFTLPTHSRVAARDAARLQAWVAAAGRGRASDAATVAAV